MCYDIWETTQFSYIDMKEIGKPEVNFSKLIIKPIVVYIHIFEKYQTFKYAFFNAYFLCTSNSFTRFYHNFVIS